MKKNGYTLIELLIVIVIFAIISIVASETIILTLRGTYKADAISKVRQSVDSALGSMERQLRGAQSITSCTATSISFVDQNSNPVTFTCNNINSNGSASNIASSSGAISSNLTANNITISACSFTCTPSSGDTPPYVLMSVTASDLAGQNAPIVDTTQVTLRSY
ncbi:hypothetical protein BH10PAT1_BH10PAT1_4300 [soil metagenome]